MLQTVFLSFIFIFCVHYLLIFFQKMLTFHKEKDFVYSPVEKYQMMYKEIIAQSAPSISSPISNNNSTSTIIQHDQAEMKNELKEYMVNYLHGMA